MSNLFRFSFIVFIVLFLLLFWPLLSGGTNYILKWVVLAQTNLTDQYYHRRELKLVSLENSFSVEFGIKKIFWIFAFYKELSRFKLFRK